MLTRSAAFRICDIVSKDVACQALLGGSKILQGSGYAGTARNTANRIAVFLGDRDMADAQLAGCIGISENTTAAIYPETIDGSKSGAGYLPEIRRAITCSREPKDIFGNAWEHHACCLIMQDGSDYVFDWWKTLDTWNPWIYVTDNWRLDNEIYVPYTMFTGFDDAGVELVPPDWASDKTF
jgi:hypothetical protein